MACASAAGFPPRVVVNDRVGARQVEADAPGLEADQEHGHIAPLEGIDRLLAFSSLAREFDGRNVALDARFFDEIDHRSKLGEHQHRASVAREVLEHFEQPLELCALCDVARRLDFDEPGIAAALAQLE